MEERFEVLTAGSKLVVLEIHPAVRCTTLSVRDRWGTEGVALSRLHTVAEPSPVAHGNGLQPYQL
jgi:hypothetical protein